MNVELSSKSAKYLMGLDSVMKTRIVKALLKLSEEPPTGDIKPLKGETNLYRIRVGDYRLIFSIESMQNEVSEQIDYIYVNKIAPRGEAYK